jgi:hypothetical protein
LPCPDISLVALPFFIGTLIPSWEAPPQAHVTLLTSQSPHLQMPSCWIRVLVFEFWEVQAFSSHGTVSWKTDEERRLKENKSTCRACLQSFTSPTPGPEMLKSWEIIQYQVGLNGVLDLIEKRTLQKTVKFETKRAWGFFLYECFYPGVHLCVCVCVFILL